MRIAFFGNNHSLLSIACLKGLIQCGKSEILVGIDRMLRKRIIPSIVKGIRLYGPGTFAMRTLMLTLPVLLPGLRMNQTYGSSLVEIARKRGISWFECVDINGVHEIRKVSDFAPDLIVVSNFSQILRQEALSLPAKGCINVHPSLLPKYRGPLPLYWALRNGEKTTGVSIHFMDEGIDTGDIIVQRSILIDEGDTEAILQQKAAALSEKLLQEVVSHMCSGPLPRKAQEDAEASYFSFPRRMYQNKGRTGHS